MCCVTPAFADSTSNGQGTAQAGAEGGQVVFAPVSGDVNNRYSAGSAIAPQLVAGLDTCMGSSSSAIQGPSFGVSLGSTWKDVDCRVLKNGRELWNMGMRAAALATLCTDDTTRYAVAVTGGLPYTRPDGVVVHRACPMTKAEWEAQGKPLLDPVTGTALTAAELNPPIHTAATVDSALQALTPQQKQELVEHVKAEIVQQHAVEAQAEAVKLKVVTTAAK